MVSWFVFLLPGAFWVLLHDSKDAWNETSHLPPRLYYIMYDDVHVWWFFSPTSFANIKAKVVCRMQLLFEPFHFTCFAFSITSPSPNELLFVFAVLLLVVSGYKSIRIVWCAGYFGGHEGGLAGRRVGQGRGKLNDWWQCAVSVSPRYGHPEPKYDLLCFVTSWHKIMKSP